MNARIRRQRRRSRETGKLRTRQPATTPVGLTLELDEAGDIVGTVTHASKYRGRSVPGFASHDDTNVWIRGGHTEQVHRVTEQASAPEVITRPRRLRDGRQCNNQRLRMGQPESTGPAGPCVSTDYVNGRSV